MSFERFLNFAGSPSSCCWQPWTEEEIPWQNDWRTTCCRKNIEYIISTTPLYVCVINHNTWLCNCMCNQDLNIHTHKNTHTHTHTHTHIHTHTQAYCVTEPGCGSDVNGIQTRAVKKGDDVRKLNLTAWRQLEGFIKTLIMFNSVGTDNIMVYSNYMYMYL